MLARLERCAAVLVAVAVATVIAVYARWGVDWPAQEFRAWTAAHRGLTVWTNNWYAGLALPGYSVLYPIVAGSIGAAATGVVAVTAIVAGALGFAPKDSRLRAAGFALSVLFVLAGDLLIGQIPFLLGVAFGVWALRALVSGAPWPVVALLAAGASLASPLPGLFLLLAAPALACAVGVRRTMPFAAGVLGILVAAAVGGAGGAFPFQKLSIVWTALFVLSGLVLATSRQRPLLVFVGSFGVVEIVDLLIANPVGGNLVRLGQLVALPLVWLVVPGSRLSRLVPWAVPRAAVAALLVGAAGLWPSYPAIVGANTAARTASQHAAYYRGLLHFLAGQDPRRGRLEAAFSRQHWESYFVARAYPLARGWERQTDENDNAVLYHPLTPAIYRRWLDANAVDLVALPRETLDGHFESDLLKHPPAYLVPAWHDANWQVWRVRDATPLASRPATLTSLGTASLTLRFARAGTSTVRIHDSNLWDVTQGRACLASGPDGFLDVRAAAPGTVTLRARVGWNTLVHRPASAC